MPRKLRIVWLSCYLGILMSLCGCSYLEYLSPSQIWKINRYPASNDMDGAFSVREERTSAEVRLRRFLEDEKPTDHE